MQSYDGVASGSFFGPDHEYPSALVLRLAATDAQGASAATSVRLVPRTVDLTVASDPAGLEVALNATSGPAPLSETVIEGSRNTIGASSPQRLGNRWFEWISWSDGGAPTHTVIADASRAYSAAFSSLAGPPSPPPPAEPPGGEPQPLELETLKLRIPKSRQRLLARGGRAKLRCNLDCEATLKLVAEGRHARRAGIEGTIARSVAGLEADTPTWVAATLRRRAERRLREAPGWLTPKVRAEIGAR